MFIIHWNVQPKCCCLMSAPLHQIDNQIFCACCAPRFPVIHIFRTYLGTFTILLMAELNRLHRKCLRPHKNNQCCCILQDHFQSRILAVFLSVYIPCILHSLCEENSTEATGHYIHTYITSPIPLWKYVLLHYAW